MRFSMQYLVKAKGLTNQQFRDIELLEEALGRYEKLSMKLNKDMLASRSPNEVNDFLFYEDDRLIGFLGLYGFGHSEIELTGMVLPEKRRAGIFSKLFHEAKTECFTRGVEKMLLITERSSLSGTAYAKSTGAKYAFSEYRMLFNDSKVPEVKRQGIVLRKAEPSDREMLHGMDALFFGAEGDPEWDNSLDRIQYRIELGDQTLGKIGLTMEGESAYIFGVGILPEYRGRGYAREALSLILTQLKSQNIPTALLEVAVANESALWVYESCGFKKDTVYDYYEIFLRQDSKTL